MTAKVTGSLVVLVALVSAGSVLAHHSLANFDTTKAIRVKGTVVRFHKINPHSFIYVEEKSADGQTRRWAGEGPGVLQLDRRGVAEDFLKPGDEVEVCGYAHKENVIWQIASATPTVGELEDAEQPAGTAEQNAEPSETSELPAAPDPTEPEGPVRQ